MARIMKKLRLTALFIPSVETSNRNRVATYARSYALLDFKNAVMVQRREQKEKSACKWLRLTRLTFYKLLTPTDDLVTSKA